MTQREMVQELTAIILRGREMEAETRAEEMEKEYGGGVSSRVLMRRSRLAAKMAGYPRPRKR